MPDSDGFELNRELRQLRWRGLVIELTVSEVQVLECLRAHQGGPVSRAMLESALAGEREAYVSNAIEAHISNLRRKLGRDCIQTIRGRGYRLSLSLWVD